MVAAAAAAAIGGAFSLAGASKGAKAAERAAQTEADAMNAATALQREMFETGREDMAPYRAVGVPALNRLASAYGVAPAATNALAPPDRTTQGTTRPMTPDERAMWGVDPEPSVTAPPGSTEAELQRLGFGRATNRLGQTLSAAELVANFQPQSLQTFLSLDDAGKKNWMAQSGITPKAVQAPAPQMVDVATQGGPDPVEASQDMMNRLAAGFKESPDYQFRLKEGENALMRGQAARGKLLSGEGVKEGLNFASNLASGEFGNFMTRAGGYWSDYANRLAAIAGVGQTATNQGVAAGQNFASNTGNMLMAGGANQANAMLAGGAIQAGGFGNIGQGIQNAYSAHQFRNALAPQQQASPWVNPDMVRRPMITGTAGFGGVGAAPY